MTNQRTTTATRTGAVARETILDRVPPNNCEAETALLGSILLAPDVMDDVALVVDARDFYEPANGLLYDVMRDMHEGGRRLDVTLIADRLKSAGHWEAIGGAPALARISQAVPNAAHARWYAGVIREKSLLRSLIEASTAALRDAYEQTDRPAAEVVESAEARMYAVAERGVAIGARVVAIRDVVRDALERIDARREGVLAGAATGYAGLDQLLGGLRPRELTVLGGRPGQGKTALGLAIAARAAVDGPVLFVSLEMSQAELSERLLSMQSRVNLYRMRNAMMNADERRRIIDTAGRLATAQLWIEDSPSRTVSQIGALARRHARRFGLSLLVVDYLQLVTPTNSRDPRHEQVGQISRRCKELARELDVAVLVLAQVNRSSEDQRRAPRLSELRESGSIEQDDDVVLFVHRPAEYDRTRRPASADEAETAELIVAKHRNGPVGTVEVNWRREYALFENRDERAPDFPAWREDYWDREPTGGDWGPAPPGSASGPAATEQLF